MKKIFSFLTLSFLAFSVSANAVIHSYLGLTVGGVEGSAKGNGFSTSSSTGGTVGGVIGAELNLLIIKFGVEGFVDKSFSFNSGGYKDPLFYGGKGKVFFNFVLFDPYLALGYGQEKANNSYSNGFGIGSLGVQTKLLNIGAFAELNHLRSLKSDSDGRKTNRTSLQVGLKYYFL